MHFQLQQKCEEGCCASIIAKNEYLLTISAANSHQKRYYEVDLPEAIRVCEQKMHFLYYVKK